MLAAAAVLVFAQALLIQSTLSQSCGYAAFAPGLASPFNLAAPAFGYNGLVGSLACDSPCAPAIEITPTSGGALPVTSASPIAPNSLVVTSENVYEGALTVAGEVPFVGTVGLEGVLPTAGSGAINHACGNGATRMTSLDGGAIAPGFGPIAGIAPGNVYGGIGAFDNAAVARFGYGAGLTGLTYPTTGLAGAYPAPGFPGSYPAPGFIGARPAPGFTGAYPAPGFIGAHSAPGFAGAYPALGLTGTYPATSCGAALAPYGGAGEGNVAVAGELPVAGNTAVAGQVPIMGAVNFGGAVPAGGAVSISGNCACGCGNP